MPIPTVITDLSATAASNYPAGTDAPSVLDDVQRVHASFIRNLLDATISNAYTAYTTGGTSTAYTITPSPAITAYAANQSFFVRFNAACGASPTLQISGLATPPNLVKQLGGGTFANVAAGDIPIDHRSRVTLLSATQALVEDLPDLAFQATEAALGRLRLASAAQARALTDDLTAITPLKLANALQGTNQSIATSGYQKLPGGLIVQWGNAVVTLDAGGIGTINYPLSFPAAVFTVVVANGDTAAHGEKGFAVGTQNTTGFTFGVKANPGAVNVRAAWVAFGN